jgi:hypothetical protein
VEEDSVVVVLVVAVVDTAEVEAQGPAVDTSVEEASVVVVSAAEQDSVPVDQWGVSPNVTM